MFKVIRARAHHRAEIQTQTAKSMLLATQLHFLELTEESIPCHSFGSMMFCLVLFGGITFSKYYNKNYS